MSKYQLSDLVNGNFGNLYGTMTEAELALDAIVAEYLNETIEGFKAELESDSWLLYPAEPEFKYLSELSGESDEGIFRKVAERRIRDFHSIEEVET